MKAVFSIVFCLLSLLSFGQTPQADTTRARQLLDLADSLSVNTTEFLKVGMLCDSALALLDGYQPATNWLLSRAHYRKASNFGNQRNGAKMLPEMEEALRLRTGLFNETHPAMAECWLGISNAYYLLSKPAEGVEAGEKARQMFVAAYGENHVMVARCHLSIANCTYGNYRLALDHLGKAMQILKNIGREKSMDAGRCYQLMSIQYLNFAGNNEACIENAKNALSVFAHLGRDRQPAAGACYLLQGIAWGNKGYFPQQLKYLEQARSIFLENFGELNPMTATTYLKIGEAYYAIGDVNGSTPYYYKALDIMTRLNNTAPELLSAIYFALGVGCWVDEDWDKSLSYFQKAIEESGKYLKEINGPAFENISLVLYEKGDFENSRRYSRMLLDSSCAPGSTLPAYLEAMHLIYNLDARQGDFSAFRSYYPCLLDKLEKNPNPAAKGRLSRLYTLNGRIYMFENQLDIALRYFENALTAIGDREVDLIQQASVSGYMADCYRLKYRQDGNRENLERAAGLYRKGISQYVASKAYLNEPDSKTRWSDAFFPLYEGLIASDAAFFEYDKNPGRLEEAFAASESAKAALLREGVTRQAVLSVAGVADSLLEKESNLRTDITKLQQQIFYAKNTADSVHIPEWQGQLADTKQVAQTLLSAIETAYPDYYRLKYNTRLAAVADIQKRLLDDDTALLEYFAGDSSIFIFTLTKNGLQLSSATRPKNLEATVELLRKSFTDNELRFVGGGADVFTGASADLYDLLLAGPLSALPSGIKNLVVVPDGLLGYLPFEVLGKTSGVPDFKTFDYLLRHFNVSYAASANLLLEQFEKLDRSREGTALFAGFAPSYDAADTLDWERGWISLELVRDGRYSLPGAAKEVKEIAAVIGGDSFLAAAATEFNFKKNASHYRILHLAMHSALNDRYPMYSKLLFTKTAKQSPTSSEDDNDLDAAELYNFRLPATALVVLSACNTGVGKLRRGEGIMSLSRAFAYAGVPATVMSLWKVPDDATRQVMVGFYQNLKRGMRKDEALRQAKLTYLFQCLDTTASPYYWAGFVASGDMRALFGR